MVKRPTNEDFDYAAAWLACNEGPLGESGACARVAEWLMDQSQQSTLRLAARAAGVPIWKVRKRVNELQKETSA